MQENGALHRPRRLLAGALLGGAIVWGCLAIGCGSDSTPEQHYLGMSTTEWEDAIRRDAHAGDTETFDRLVAGGPDAIPVLMAQFGTSDTWSHRSARLALLAIGEPAVQPLAELVEHGTEDEARWAALVLGRMGTVSAEAAPALASRLERSLRRDRNSVVAVECRGALIQMGPQAIDHVIPLVHHRHTRETAFEILEFYDLHAIPALEDLKRTEVPETSREAFRSAAEILAFQGVMDDNLRAWQRKRERERAGTVRDLLSTDERLLSASRAEELGILDESIDEAMEVLMRFLDSADGVERRRAARALISFGARIGEATPLLVQLLDYNDPHLSWEIMRALAELGPGARAAVPSLVARLHNAEDITGQRYAAYTLAAIGLPAPEAMAPLDKMLEHRLSTLHHFGDQLEIRRTAIYAMARIIPAEQAVPRLIALFDDEFWIIQRDAIEALAIIGPPAIPALREVFLHGTEHERRNAICALMRIGKDSALGWAVLDSASGDADDPLVGWVRELARDLSRSRGARTASAVAFGG